MNNRIYRPTLRKGTRIRVLDTGELGTIADKMLIQKDGTVRTYCKVRLDKKPKEDTWYFAEQLGDTKECAFVTFGDHTDRRIIVGIEIDYENSCVSALKVKGLPDDPDKHTGLYRHMAANFLKKVKEFRPCSENKQ